MGDYSVDGKACCPHCGRTVQFAKGDTDYLHVQLYRTDYALRWVECPSCDNLVITLIHQEKGENPEETIIYPLHTQRPPVPPEVPATIKTDYDEAAQILSLSPKGSAALSRRCLQRVLVSEGKAMKKSLDGQIEEVSSQVPGYLTKMLQQVRTIGNFAAHPMKDTTTEAIVDVVPGEAEWNLDVLDQLFDFYYVKPAIVQTKTAKLDDKLKAVGKKPI